MRELRSGVAHLSYRGGGLFLPAQSPYDREILVELAIERVRTKGPVQILLDDRRWMLQPTPSRTVRYCALCGRGLGAVWMRAADDAVAYCVPCAILGVVPPR